MVIPRRVALLGLAALILVGAGIAAAATYEDDDDTPAALEQPATTTTSTVPADTTTTVAATSTIAPAPTTTVAGARTTTTRRGATTTPTRAGATTTTAPTGPDAPCTTAQMEAAVTTDKASYAIGEQVRIHSTLRNRSATTCTYPSFVFEAVISGPTGARGTGFDRVGAAPGALGAGQANEAFVNWDRVACTSDICPPHTPGEYTVTATWNFPGGPYTATKKISLPGP